MLKLFLLFIVFFLAFNSQAQSGSFFKRYSAGYRISEIDAIGTNPLSISPLLKNPDNYNRFLSTFIYNAYTGNPAIQTLHSVYLNAEFYKNRHRGVWKNTYLQGGLFLTNHLRDDAGTLENHYLADTTAHNDFYTLVHHTQYLGLNLGINHSTRLGKRLHSTIGVQVLGAVALLHYYQQRVDSSERRGDYGNWDTTYSKQFPDLKGKHYFQWQIMVPLGIEYEIDKQKRLTLRAEVAPGYIRSRYRNKSFAPGEAHSAGLWVIYKL